MRLLGRMMATIKGRKRAKKRIKFGLGPAYWQAGVRSTLFFALFVPTITHAAMQITEVMYDPPGANAGSQWLELTNVGDTAVSFGGYKINEGGANHKIIISSGTTTLAVGASAVVASDPQTFLSQFPTYGGTLLKSAFSFASKKGETITLKDAKSQAVDSVSYDPSAGASGDGNTLHRQGSVLVVGAPNPGSTAHTEPLQPKDAPSTAAANVVPKASTHISTKTSKSATSVKTIPQSGNHTFTNDEVAAPLLSRINLPHGAAAWVLGGLGLLLLGISASWYLWLRARERGNLLGSEAFTIEE